MTSTAQNVPPMPPPSTDNSDVNKIDGDVNKHDSVMNYLTKCGLASHSEISVDDIDESTLALLSELSIRHLVVGGEDGDDKTDGNDTTEKSVEETAEKALDEIEGKPRGNDNVTNVTDEDDDDDEDDEDDDGATLATDRAVIIDVTTCKKKSDSKKPSDPIAKRETDAITDLRSRFTMSQRSGSLSSFKDKEDESSVQNLYSEYKSLFGVIDGDAKRSTGDSIPNTITSRNKIKPANLKTPSEDGYKQPPTNSTSNCNTTHNDVRLQNLEPWQEALFERQDRHEKALLQCQAKMDVIAKLFVAVSEQPDDYVQNLENRVDGGHQNNRTGLRRRVNASETNVYDDAQNSNQQQRANQDILYEAPQPQLQQQHQYQHQYQHQQQPRQDPLQPQQRFLVKIGSSLLHIFRKTYRYLSTTRIVRLIALVRNEAERHPMPGGPNARFLDWNLIFKMFFVCFVFGARLKNNGGMYGDSGRGKVEIDENLTWYETMLAFWKIYRAHVFVMCALTTYVLQTGLGQFLHRIIVKENILQRVWRNEDILDEVEGGGMVGEGVGVGDVRQRRGRRDRLYPLDNNGDGEQDDELGDPLQLGGNRNAPDLRRGPLEGGLVGGGGQMYRQFQRTFLAGAVARRHGAHDVAEIPDVAVEAERVPIPNHNIHRIVDLVKDVVYLLGSIVLSLFPMWHPRVQALPPQPFRARAPVPENVADDEIVRNNDAVDGATDGNGGDADGLPRVTGENGN